MSTLTKAILLSFSIGLANSAAAEHFNDRSENFITVVKPDSQVQYPEVAVTSSHFNDRGEDFTASIKPGLQAEYPGVAVTWSHFNDRSDDYLATVLAGSGMSPAIAGSEGPPLDMHVTAAGYQGS
jgi:ABC-type glycerol-3-phosphate transport system substrate-binding protein